MIHSSYTKFSENGFEFVALATGKNKGSFANEFENKGIKIILKPLYKNLRLPLVFLPYFFAYYRFLRQEKFDVVHIHRMYLYFWYALFAKIAGVSVIIRTIHNVFKPTYRYPQFYLSRKILHHFDVVFTSVSPSVEQHELKFFKNKTVRINNWYDASRFFPLQQGESKEEVRSKLGIPLDSFVMISVGSCLPQKNHAHIIECLKRLISTHRQLFYLHIGDGPLCYEEQQYVSATGLKENSLFAGTVNNVRQYLVASDIFVMPSDYEGLGNALLESMACGVPAIGYDVAGIRDLIQPQKNGWLIPNSVDNLQQSIDHVIKDEESRLQFSKQSIELVCKEFNIDAAVSAFCGLYRRRQ